LDKACRLLYNFSPVIDLKTLARHVIFLTAPSTNQILAIFTFYDFKKFVDLETSITAEFFLPFAHFNRGVTNGIAPT